MSRSRFRVAAIAAVLLTMAASSCRRTAAVENKPAAANPPLVVPLSREADDVARFVAGLPGQPGSPFAEMEDTAAWKQHRKLLDKAWTNAGENLIDGLVPSHRYLRSRCPGACRNSAVNAGARKEESAGLSGRHAENDVVDSRQEL